MMAAQASNKLHFVPQHGVAGFAVVRGQKRYVQNMNFDIPR